MFSKLMGLSPRYAVCDCRTAKVTCSILSTCSLVGMLNKKTTYYDCRVNETCGSTEKCVDSNKCY